MKKRNKAVVRQAAKHADAIKAGISASFVASQITDAWFGSNHSDLTPQQARDWARVNVVLASGAVYAALEAIYSTGFQLGKATADEAYAQAALGAGAELTPEFKAILRTNWDTWKPGNSVAAMLVNPPEGFSQVLANRDIILRKISDTTTDRIGTILADGLSRGLPPNQVAASLTDLGLNNSRALTIATTEMNRAVQDSQFQSYQDNGVERVEWTVTQPCDKCAQNDGEIRDLGDEFPSGDIKPIVHPNCLCELIPVVDLSQYDLNSGDNIDVGDILDLAADAELTKFNENHDEQGRFSSGDGSSSSTKLVEGQNIDREKVIASLPAKPNDESIRDAQLEAIAKMQGFDKPAQVISKADVAKLENPTILYRGVMPYTNADGKLISGDAIQQEFISGQYFAGLGGSGNGTYWSTDIARAIDYADTQNGGAVIQAVLDPKAIIASNALVDSTFDANLKGTHDGVSTTLALTGYDGHMGMNLGGINDAIYVTYNRTAVKVIQ